MNISSALGLSFEDAAVEGVGGGGGGKGFMQIFTRLARASEEKERKSDERGEGRRKGFWSAIFE